MKLIGAIAIGMMAIIGTLRPAMFESRRAAKLTLLALIVPAVGYGIEVIGA